MLSNGALAFLAMLVASANPQAPEVATRDTDLPAASFRTKVSLVLVPAVVRDKTGTAIGTLKREEFELFDKGRPQAIAKFSVEKAGSRHIEFEAEPGVDPTASAAPSPGVSQDIVERYTILLFDDMHLSIADLMNVKLAAEKHLTAGMLPTERIAIFGTSGHVTLNFTNDLGKLVTTLRGIVPTHNAMSKIAECPPLSVFQAFAIDRCEADATCPAREVGIQDAYQCGGLDPTHGYQIAYSMTVEAARQKVAMSEVDNRATLINLRAVVSGLAAMPGQRNLVLVSGGFYAPNSFAENHEIIDLAIRNRVTLNALDARGLHTLSSVIDASQRVHSRAGINAKLQWERWEAESSSQTLEELAEGTGGSVFENNNDLVGGFKKLSGTPEYTYILGFSPQILKFDGSLHTLKVKLKNGSHYAVQARHGYFAPKHLADPAEEARREIEEAMFSREVMRDLPIELHSQYFKTAEFDAKLTVLTRVNLAQLSFKKEDGRNDNELTIVTALFDKDGNLLKGSKKTATLKVKDETLADKTRSVVTFKSNFDVKIGGYVIRLVVRDREGQLMTAETGSVIIP